MGVVVEDDDVIWLEVLPQQKLLFPIDFPLFSFDYPVSLKLSDEIVVCNVGPVGELDYIYVL